jgi:hypothetical protein
MASSDALLSLRQQQAQLQTRHPGWEIWYVPLALGGIRWCARHRGEPDLTHVLHAYRPDHLAEYIEDAQAEMDTPQRP